MIDWNIYNFMFYLSKHKNMQTNPKSELQNAFHKQYNMKCEFYKISHFVNTMRTLRSLYWNWMGGSFVLIWNSVEWSVVTVLLKRENRWFFFSSYKYVTNKDFLTSLDSVHYDLTVKGYEYHGKTKDPALDR